MGPSSQLSLLAFDAAPLVSCLQSYMQAHYEMDPKLNDMYFIRTDPKNRKRVEMSFNLCHYQPHLAKAAGRNLYQTIFLDAKGKVRGGSRGDVDMAARVPPSAPVDRSADTKQ